MSLSQNVPGGLRSPRGAPAGDLRMLATEVELSVLLLEEPTPGGLASFRRLLAELDGPTVYDQLVAERGGSARL